MRFTTIDPFQLIPNPWNSNKVDRENFDKLKKSLQSLGNFKPIVVREVEDKFQILGGYHRCEAAKELGIPTVPIVNLGVLDDARAKEISLIDNTRYGEDDTELLAKIMDEIDTELLAEIVPDAPVSIPDFDSLTDAIDEELKRDRDEDKSETHTVLKFRLENDKADEVETILSRIAMDYELRFPDGYLDYAMALYYMVVMGKK
jgi:ParB-like chromosome segregation protein Spo0J